MLLFNKMHFAFVVLGSRGDIQPFIPLALYCIKQKHNVTILSHEQHAFFIKQYKIPFKSIYGQVDSFMKFMKEHPYMYSTYTTILDGLCSEQYVFMEQLCISTWNHLKTMTIDVIVGTPNHLGLLHVSEKLNVPFFPLMHFPYHHSTNDIPHPFVNPKSIMIKNNQQSWKYGLACEHYMNHVFIERFRKDLKLPKQYDRCKIQKIPYMYSFSNHFLPKPKEWHSKVTCTGFSMLEETRVLQNDLKEFLSHKPIFIGFGSVKMPKKFIPVLRELVKTNNYFIISGYSQFYKDNVYNLPAFPFNMIFPHVSCVISHGGIGTIATTIKAKVPSIVVPFFGDQFLNGNIIEKKKLGFVVQQKDFNLNNILSTVEKCKDLDCKHVGDLITNEQGEKNAYEFIIRYL